MITSYRGWTISYWAKPIPTSSFDYEASHPDYDGEGDNRLVFGASIDAVKAEIDAWHEEHDEVVMEARTSLSLQTILSAPAVIGCIWLAVSLMNLRLPL